MDPFRAAQIARGRRCPGSKKSLRFVEEGGFKVAEIGHHII
jgi:hypothetical protein